MTTLTTALPAQNVANALRHVATTHLATPAIATLHVNEAGEIAALIEQLAPVEGNADALGDLLTSLAEGIARQRARAWMFEGVCGYAVILPLDGIAYAVERSGRISHRVVLARDNYPPLDTAMYDAALGGLRAMCQALTTITG